MLRVRILQSPFPYCASRFVQKPEGPTGFRNMPKVILVFFHCHKQNLHRERFSEEARKYFLQDDGKWCIICLRIVTYSVLIYLPHTSWNLTEGLFDWQKCTTTIDVAAPTSRVPSPSPRRLPPHPPGVTSPQIRTAPGEQERKNLNLTKIFPSPLPRSLIFCTRDWV